MLRGIIKIKKIIDLHCDTISALTEHNLPLYQNNCHFDLKRAMDNNIFIQFFALFTRPTDANIVLKNILLQIEKFYTELAINNEYIYLVKKYEEIDNNTRKIGAILHLEGAEAIGRDIELLRLLYRLGLRSVGLTWNYRNFIADGVGEGEYAASLTSFGKKVIREMDNLGILLDLSHIAPKAYFAAFDYYNRPIMVTHANAYSICPHPRNLTDEQLKVLADNGGIIGINQVSFFVGTQDNPGVNNLIDHIKYIADTIGVKHIALGSDFDGAEDLIMLGIEEYNKWENLLLGAGFSHNEIDMILNQNALRVIEQVLI